MCVQAKFDNNRAAALWNGRFVVLEMNDQSDRQIDTNNHIYGRNSFKVNGIWHLSRSMKRNKSSWKDRVGDPVLI